MMERRVKIGVVGACGSGKSALVNGLKERGYNARHIAQEHSYAPRMWAQISNPDFLILLEVSYPVTVKRKRFNWTVEEYQEQIFRMRHAIRNADLKIDTDNLSPDEVLAIVLDWLPES